MDEKFSENKKFKAYWDTLNRFEKIQKRREIVTGCYINYPTVTNWLYGICRIPILAQKKIEEIAGRNIFEEDIRPLYEDVNDTGNYYAGQVDYWRAKIIELLENEFDIDKSNKLGWNAKENKLFCDIG